MKRPLCPICKKAPPARATQPFCSTRCANVDLQRWLAGAYILPGAAFESESSSQPDDED